MKERTFEFLKYNILKTNENELEITTAFELIELTIKEPEPVVICGPIIEGSTGLIVGVAKTGKTTLAENIAISIAVGREKCFDFKMDGKPRKVVFINLEEGYKVRSRRMIKQIAALTPEEKLVFKENFISIPKNFPKYINTKSDWQTLENYLIRCDAEVIFIDSLTHLLPGAIEQSKIVNEFNQEFEARIMSLGKTVVIIHHNVKGNEKPIDQFSIAGSRVVTQKFEYAIGMANSPYTGNEKYLCFLYQKEFPTDDTIAHKYIINEQGWVEPREKVNKHTLYKDQSIRIDNRRDSTNQDQVLAFIENQGNQGNQTITTKVLKEEFQHTGIMSHETLNTNLNKLLDEGKIERIKKGNFRLVAITANKVEEGGQDE